MPAASRRAGAPAALAVHPAAKTPLLRALARLLDALQLAIEQAGGVLLSLMTLIILWQVVSRIHPALNAPWTEEIAMMLLVWFGLAVAAMGIRRGAHIAIDFLVDRLPAPARRAAALLVTVLIFCFSGFLLVEGVALAKGCWNDLMSATLLPRGPCIYLAVPVSAFLMLLCSLEAILRGLGLDRGDKA